MLLPYILPLIVPFIVLFALALLMPGTRSLLALAGMLGIPLGWLIAEGNRAVEEAPGGAVMGAIVTMVLLFSAAGGLASGVATRGVLLWRPGIRRSRIKSGVLVVCGIVALPLALAASLWWSS